jgi:hypothetical protein
MRRAAIAGVLLAVLLAGCAPVAAPAPRIPNTSTYSSSDLYDILHTVDLGLGGDGDLMDAAQLRAQLDAKSPQGTINILRSVGGTVLRPTACASLQSSSVLLSPASIGRIPGATFATFDHTDVTVELVTVPGTRLPASVRSAVDPTALLATCSHMKLTLSKATTLNITLSAIRARSDADPTWGFDESIVLPGGGAAQNYRYVVAIDGNLIILVSASGSSTYSRIIPAVNRVIAAAAMTHQSDS